MVVMEEFLTAKEVAKKLRLSVETVKKMLRDGELPGRKVGRKWLTSQSELAQHMEEQRKKQQGREVD